MDLKPLIPPERVKEDKTKNRSSFRKHSLSLDKMMAVRLQIFAGCILLTMALIMFQAFSITVIQAEKYTQKLVSQTTSTRSSSSMRGIIYDRNQQVLVSNRQRMNIVFYSTSSVSKSELAQRIVDLFEIDTDSLTKKELKDTYYYFYSDELDKLSVQKTDSCSVSSSPDLCLYELQLSQISDEQLQKLSDEQKAFFKVYIAMQSASSTNGSTILADISVQEAAVFLEHSSDFPGFELTFDWEREYPDSTSIRSLLGKVSDSSVGIHSENLLEYLAKGYTQTDKIGISGLEYVYEDLLKGKSTISSVSLDEDGEIISSVIDNGARGYDLTLALDMRLQEKAEKITQSVLEKVKDDPRREYMDQILVAAMDPNNGDVLCMVSMIRSEDGGYYNDSSAVYVQSFVPGSIVKGATLYMGLDQGVVEAGEIMVDEPLKIANSPSKSSWSNLGAISDIQALALSSNVYMMKIALRLAGTNYKYNGGLYVKNGTFDLMRSYYNTFGLGVLTEADVYNEQLGYIGDDSKDGNILDYAIGQYDTYTTLELAQYISTIANGGKRLKPRILLHATLPMSDEIIYSNDVQILNVLENEEALSRVQQGFRACVVSGLCSSLNSASVSVAAKTGTAEAYLQITDENGKSQVVASPNNSVVAYAPAEDPQIAMACMIPHAWNGTTSQTNLCLEIVKEVTEAYLQ